MQERRAVDGHAVAYPRSHRSMRSFERHGDRSITFSLPRGEQTAQNPAPREVVEAIARNLGKAR